jgi:hypothetical protein
MRLFQTIILAVFITSCSNSQDTKPDLTGEVKHDLKILLPNDEVKVDIIDGVKMDPRYELLYSKFMTAVQQNNQWFLGQQKIIEETGKPMPYHPNTGLTEEEYFEFKALMEKGPGIEMVKSGTAKVMFNFQDEIIYLKGTDRLEILNDVKIDLANNAVWIGDYKLDNFQEINVDTDNNGLKSKWNGYQWRYEYTNKPDGFSELSSTDDLQTLIMKQYKLTIGRLDKDKSTYIEITEKEIENGLKTKTIQIPFKF